ncbi:hypothetical protein BDV12DRAFT_187151 [Aspergillus spectabilis]
MSSLRFARSALRARPATFRVPLQRRGYAEAVSDKIKLSLVLPHQTIFRSTDVVQVNIPAESGEMGVLANHVPSIEQLKPGLVEIVEEGGASKKFFLSGGFAVVQPDSQLSINAVEGYPLEEFSVENVRSQIAEAQKIASGSGSEQDIAEAKVELELPTNLPNPFSPESRLIEESCFSGSYLFKCPGEWQTQATSPGKERSASPILTQGRPRTLDRISGDGSYKDLLFTFPRLYSDLTSERDPFLESRGMPLNPHNTPISLSGRQSEIGSWAKDKRNVLTPVKIDKHTLYRSSDADASDDNPLTPLFNGRESTWRPPKPPKPSFLSDVAISIRDDAENIRPTLKEEPFERDENRRPLPENSHRSLPLRASRKLGQPTERPVTEQAPEHRTVRPKQSWETRSIVPCRYFPRPFTRQELEILGIPLNNPDMPFPAPIPTIDNLPLRRGIINFDWKQADQYPVDANCVPTTSTDQPGTINGPSNAVRRISQNALALGKLTKNLLCGLTPWRQKGLPTKQNPTVRTAITVPFISRCETCSVEPEQVSAFGLVDGAYVLQLKLAFPLLLIHRTTILANIIRVGTSSKIAQTAASIVRAFVEIIIQWLLSVFQIEVAIELRRT